jgi:uncharacterized protein (DUF305 family)
MRSPGAEHGGRRDHQDDQRPGDPLRPLNHLKQGGAAHGGAPATAANDADVGFTQNMIPHHQQAIEMAELVDSRTRRPELRTLAGRIAASQGREVTLMQGWLQAWGKPAAPHMDHGGVHMPGMMSEVELRQLMATRQQHFDLLFLDLMRAHHQGAIEMATTELRDGALPQVKRLAQQIIDDQQAEIDQFRQWQQEWAAPNR